MKRIGGQFVAHLTERPFAYSFEVILAAEATEPASLPGGYVLIPARFFLAAQDEAEFAGMLAHSIGHTALRHGTQTNKVNVFVGGWMGCHTDSSGPATPVPVGFREFQRQYELEADTFGLELAARAGYAAAAFRRYIERTQVADWDKSPLPLTRAAARPNGRASPLASACSVLFDR